MARRAPRLHPAWQPPEQVGTLDDEADACGTHVASSVEHPANRLRVASIAWAIAAPDRASEPLYVRRRGRETLRPRRRSSRSRSRTHVCHGTCGSPAVPMYASRATAERPRDGRAVDEWLQPSCDHRLAARGRRRPVRARAGIPPPSRSNRVLCCARLVPDLLMEPATVCDEVADARGDPD